MGHLQEVKEIKLQNNCLKFVDSQVATISVTLIVL
jgi:hypothetical protein